MSRKALAQPIIEIIQHFAAPPSIVWARVREPVAVRQWFGAHMHLDARPRGSFVETWFDGDRMVTTTGEMLRIDPAERLDLSWHDEEWPVATTVSIALEREDRATRLILCRDGRDALGTSAAALAAQHLEGWGQRLEALRRFAEGAQGIRR